MSFAKSVGKNIGRNISNNLSGKYSQKRLGHAKQSATDAFKEAPKRKFQKTAEATGDTISKIAELQKFQKIHSKIFQRQ